MACCPNWASWDRVGGTYAWWEPLWRISLPSCSEHRLAFLERLTKVRILRKTSKPCLVLAVMFLAGKCYLPALVQYHANMWVKMYFRRVAMAPQYIYWDPESRASLKFFLKEFCEGNAKCLVNLFFKDGCPMAFPLLITVCSREQVIPILARYASSKHCKWLQVKLLASSVD